MHEEIEFTTIKRCEWDERSFLVTWHVNRTFTEQSYKMQFKGKRCCIQTGIMTVKTADSMFSILTNPIKPSLIPTWQTFKGDILNLFSNEVLVFLQEEMITKKWCYIDDLYESTLEPLDKYQPNFQKIFCRR